MEQLAALEYAYERIAELELALERSDEQLIAQVERAADTRDHLVRLKESVRRKRAEIQRLKDENQQLTQRIAENDLQHAAFVAGLHEAYVRALGHDRTINTQVGETLQLPRL